MNSQLLPLMLFVLLGNGNIQGSSGCNNQPTNGTRNDANTTLALCMCILCGCGAGNGGNSSNNGLL